MAKEDESPLLSCRSATVSQVVWFFDALNCFSASDSIFNALLNFSISSSAVKKKNENRSDSLTLIFEINHIRVLTGMS